MIYAKFGFLVALVDAFTGCTAAPDPILLNELGEDNRCHMKIEIYGDPAKPTEREVVIITVLVMNALALGGDRGERVLCCLAVTHCQFAQCVQDCLTHSKSYCVMRLLKSGPRLAAR